MTEPGTPTPPAHLTPAERRLWSRMVDEGYTPDEALDAVVTSRGDVGQPSAGATGTLSYGLGLLAYLPIPVLSLVVAGVVMAAVYPSQRRRSPLAAENARRAANWGLTLVAGTLLCIAAALSVAAWMSSTGAEGPGPAALPLVGVLLLGLVHVVVVVMGLVRTRHGDVFENRLAIPFLRR